jgi:hypothetical protein
LFIPVLEPSLVPSLVPTLVPSLERILDVTCVVVIGTGLFELGVVLELLELEFSEVELKGGF